MKTITMILVAALLSGCSLFQTKENVPVWTPPKFDMPKRPVLTCDGTGTDGEVARKLSVDLYNMTLYSQELEKLLKTIKSQAVTQNTSNNK